LNAYAKRQTSASTPGWKDSELYFGKPDPNIAPIADQYVGAGERQLSTAADAGASNRSDGWKWKILPALKQLLTQTYAGRRYAWICDARYEVEIGARNESFRFGREQDEAPNVTAIAQLRN